ncbi:MAG TPA: hypothetical protein GX521_09475 [Firmicutes bacterium]|nr:hypothetical protein [Bacillota bacterium]
MLGNLLFTVFGLAVVAYMAKEIKAFVDDKYSPSGLNTDPKARRWRGMLAFLAGFVGGVLTSRIEIGWGLDIFLIAAVALLVTWAVLDILSYRRIKDSKIKPQLLLIQIMAAVALVVLLLLRFRPY